MGPVQRIFSKDTNTGPCYNCVPVLQATPTQIESADVAAVPSFAYVLHADRSDPVIIEHLGSTPLKSTRIRELAGRNLLLAVIRRFALQCWPDVVLKG